MRAAERLELPNRVLAAVLGLSEATVSRMGAGAYQLDPDGKPFELAVFFLRLFRSLDAIVGGDVAVARAWLRKTNTAFGAAPITLIESVAGLVKSLPTWTTAALSPEIRRALRALLARRRGTTRRVDDGARRHARGAGTARAGVGRQQARGAGGLPQPPLPVVYSVPIWRSLSARDPDSDARASRQVSSTLRMQITTAVAEMAFWRLLFYAESPDTPWPANAGEYTAFSVRFSTGKGLDLTRPPFDRDAETVDASERLLALPVVRGRGARGGQQVLRYQSARADGINVALLTCAAFASRAPLEHQRWRIHVGTMGVRAICELSGTAAGVRSRRLRARSTDRGR